MENLIGKMVIGNDGFSKRIGKVIDEEVKKKYGFDCWVIRWEDGSLDTHSKHTLKHESEHVGIGVYWIDEEIKMDEEEKETFYFENNTGLLM